MILDATGRAPLGRGQLLLPINRLIVFYLNPHS